MKKILLHTCCGPCFLGVWEDLKSKDLGVTNYFYNPNIWPKEEHDLRKANLEKTAKDCGTKVIFESYAPEEYARSVGELKEAFPARCLKCYELRLAKTAKYAKANNYDYFSTTLLVSPYQNHEALMAIGKRIQESLGVKFYEADWRNNFKTGQNNAKEMDIYRQKYCGCEPSSEYR